MTEDNILARNLAQTSVALGSLGLLANSTRVLPKFSGKGMNMKITPVSPKTFLKVGTQTLVGASLLGAGAKIANNI